MTTKQRSHRPSLLCLLLQNDITANCRYTALNQYLLLFFFKILSHICTHNYTIHFTRCFAPVICVSYCSAGEQGTAPSPCHSRIRFRVKLNLPVILPLPPVLWCMCSFPQCKRQFFLHENQFDCRTLQTCAGGLKLFTDFYSRSISQVKIPFCFPST